MVKIQDTAIWPDVLSITGGPKHPRFIKYELGIKNGSTVIKAMKLESMFFKRDYLRDFAETLTVVCWFTEQQIIDYVYPHTQDLEVIVYRIPMSSAEPDAVKLDGTVTTYKAILLDKLDTNLGADNAQARDASQTMYQVNLQLINEAVYQMRMSPVSGIFAQTSAGKLLETQITRNIVSLDMDEANRPLGADMVEPDTNDSVRVQINVPPGTRLVDLPGFLQHHCGIYNNGLGSFYQGRHWYIFPLTDDTRYYNADTVLNVFRIPPSSMPDLDRSYRITPGQVSILGGESLHTDLTDAMQLNGGNATIVIDPTGLLQSSRKSEDSKVVANGVASMGVIATEKRSDGLNNITHSSSRITKNTAREVSKLNMSNIEIVKIKWGYSNLELIYPGMPVRLVYNADKDIQFKVGTVVGVETFVQLAQPGMANEAYFENSVLELIVRDPQPRMI